MTASGRPSYRPLAWAVLAAVAIACAWIVGAASSASSTYAALGATLTTVVGLIGLAVWARGRERQRAMLSALVDGLVATAPDGRILEVNDAFCALVGRSRAELVGALPPYAFWPRADHASWPDTWAQWSQAEPRSFVAGWVTAEGEPLSVQVQTAVARDRRGRVRQRVATARDITTTHALQSALDAERDLSRAVLGAMRDGFAVTDHGRVTEVNDELCRMLGFTRQELIGTTAPYPFWPPELVEDATTLRDRIVKADGGDFEIVFCRKGGERFPAVCAARPARDVDGTVIGYVTSIRDVSADRLREDGLRRLAETDPLTGVANRRTFDELLAGALTKGRQSCVIVLDLNDFKRVNDAHGHSQGDAVLRDATAAWASVLRDGDVLARLGGDEFGVLLRQCDLASAQLVVDRLRAVLRHPPGAGIGLGAWDGQESPAELVARADRELYADKTRASASRLADPARLAAVRAAGGDDPRPNPELDELADSIARVIDVPIAFVSLVGERSLRVVAQEGLDMQPGAEVALEDSFCRHVVTTGRALVVGDSATDALAPGAAETMGIRAYAGFPLTGAGGATVGAFCAADSHPRAWDPEELKVLEVAAKRVSDRLGAPTGDPR